MRSRLRIIFFLIFASLTVYAVFFAAGCGRPAGNLAEKNSSAVRKPVKAAPPRLKPAPERMGKEETPVAPGQSEQAPGAANQGKLIPTEQSSPAVQPLTSPNSSSKFLVVVDPGHGNPGNPGSRGPSGLEERTVNLDIAQRLRKLLESAGIRVIMTRNGPTTPLGNPERAELANKNHADLFFRIHSDSSRNPEEGGTRTLWYKPDSERVAQVIQKAVVKELGLKDLGTRKQFLVGFHYAQVPAVLVEVAYNSNPSEEKLLADPSFRQRAAQGMFNGIREFLEAKN